MREVLTLIPEYLTDTFFTYTLMSSSGKEGSQVENSKEGYADPLFDGLLISLLPKVQEAYGKTLAPTYSFYRVYNEGNQLDPHLDRPACQVSVTLCLGYNFDYMWPIFVSGEPYGLKPGQAIIYNGCEELHWREPLRKPPEQIDNGKPMIHSQVFLHYIEKEGPYYPEHFLDGREGGEI